jgi:hypothetical protein
MVEVIRQVEEQPDLDLTRAVVMFTSSGRGRRLERFRPTLEDLERSLPEPYRSHLYPRLLRSEGEWVKLLASGDERANRRAMEFNPDTPCLLVEADGNVYAPASVAAECVREGFRLGNVFEEDFLSLLHRLLEQRPPEPAALERVTWGELAVRYGDPSNERLYYLPFDLVPNKWSRAYLREGAFGSG